MTTILVTGATGFLGTALVTELVKRNQEVRLLVCDAKKAREQFGDAVCIVPGEITDTDARLLWVQPPIKGVLPTII